MNGLTLHPHRWLSVLGLSLGLGVGTPTLAQPIALQPGFGNQVISLPAPAAVTNHSLCGQISAQPSQVVQLNQRWDFLAIRITGTKGTPTLLLKGPKGEFCALSDPASQLPAEVSGVWLPGTYELYGGNLNGSPGDQTLTMSEIPLP